MNMTPAPTASEAEAISDARLDELIRLIDYGANDLTGPECQRVVEALLELKRRRNDEREAALERAIQDKLGECVTREWLPPAPGSDNG